MKTITLLISLLLPALAVAESRTIRDSTGRIIGTVESGARSGAVRDRSGRIRYTVERSRSGSLIIRDRSGRIISIITNQP